MARKINTGRTSGSGTVKDGIYEMIVVEAVEGKSQSQNDMVTLQLAIFRNGRAAGRLIWDYLIFDDEDLKEDDPNYQKFQWKWDQFHDALGIEEDLEITAKYYKGKRVFASLTTDEYGGNVKNKIKAYLNADVALNLLEKQNAGQDEDGFVETPQVTQESSVSSAKRGRPKTQPAEMEEESMPL